VPAWAAVIAASPFATQQVFDGAEEPPVPSEGATGGLLWYELTREARAY